jgi:hypothetical protein
MGWNRTWVGKVSLGMGITIILYICKFYSNLPKILNLKLLFRITLVILTAPLLTGCMLSYGVVHGSGTRTVDTLHPSAVYRLIGSTNNFALEGMKKNCFYGEKPPFKAYVFIPDFLISNANLQASNTLSIENIRALGNAKSWNFPDTGLKCKKKLPRNYEKISDLPDNNITFEVKEHHPYAYVALFLPVAVVADVVTFPFQVVFVWGHMSSP